MRNYEKGLPEHAYRYWKMTELGLSTLEKSLFFSTYLRRSLEPVPDIVETAYEKYKPLIAAIYGEDSFKDDYLFHGTGRFHYQPDGSHKYDVYTNCNVVDVLQTILLSGLQPQKDVWVPTPVSSPTVSLTCQRFYAKWYADRHNYDDLLWSYGNSLDWASLFTVQNISRVLEIPYIALLLRTQIVKKSGGLLGSVHSWVSDVRNDITARTSYLDSLRTRSTIPDNYGVILAVKMSEALTYDIPLLRRSEKRTLDPIIPDAFAVIEVPLKQVANTKMLLAETGYSHLPVLPIECVDLHMSRFRLEELTKMDEDPIPAKPNIERMHPSQFDFSPITYNRLMEAAGGEDGHRYSPQKLLSVLDESPLLHALLSQQCSWEGFSIRYHTLVGLLLFEKYGDSLPALPDIVRKDFFKIFFSLHDIGDSLGKTTKAKLTANRTICVEMLSRLGFDPHEVLIAETLLSDDPIGSYLKRVGTVMEILAHVPEQVKTLILSVLDKTLELLTSETKERIRRMADTAHMNYSDFLNLVTTFHMIDAGAYTSTAGTMGSLNYIFAFDMSMRKMTYSSIIQPLIDLLKP